MAKLTPLKAIRKKCLDCCAGQVDEVRACELENCTLHPYRMGHRPQDNKISLIITTTKKREIARGF